jgi:transposase
MAKRDLDLEAKIITLVSLGYDNQQLAEALDRSVKSIEGHIRRLRARGFDLPSRRGWSLSQWHAAKAEAKEEATR